MPVMLFTEQCLQRKLHLSVTMIVPRIGSVFRNRIVFTPKDAKRKNVAGFIGRPYGLVALRWTARFRREASVVGKEQVSLDL